MSAKNYERGTRAERRIAKAIKALYAHEAHAELIYKLEEENGKNPDLVLNDSLLGIDYQIECKSLIHPIRAGKLARAGYVKIPYSQIWKMVELHNTDNHSLLIAEIRSGGGAGKTVIAVPWQKVFDKWHEGKPALLSLGFWWLLNNGVPLEIWWGALRYEPMFTELKVDERRV